MAEGGELELVVAESPETPLYTSTELRRFDMAAKRRMVLLELEADSLVEVTGVLERRGVEVDRSFGPIPMPEEETLVLRAWVDPAQIEDLRRVPGVCDISEDAPIGPFQGR